MLNLQNLAQTLLSSSMEEAEQSLLLIAAQAGKDTEAFSTFRMESFRRGHMWAVDAHVSSFPAWSGEDYMLWVRGLSKAAPANDGWYGGIPTPTTNYRLMHRTCTGRTIFAVLPKGVLVLVRAVGKVGHLGTTIGGDDVQNVIVIKAGAIMAFAGPIATKRWMTQANQAWEDYQKLIEDGASSYHFHEQLEAIRASQDGITPDDSAGLGLSWEALMAFRDQAERRAERRRAQTAWERQERLLEDCLGRPMPMAR